MFQSITDEQKTYISNWLIRFFKFDTKQKLIPVDFSKAWWKVFLSMPFALVVVALSPFLYTIPTIIAPLAIAYAAEQRSLLVIIYLIAALIISRVFSYIAFWFNPYYFVTLSQSVSYFAYQRLLIVDPIAHSTRSSGQIIAKIQRGASAIKIMLDGGVFTILPILARIIVITAILWSFSVVLAVTIVLFALFIIFLSWLGFRIRSIIMRKERIKRNDEATAANIESMQQIHYIRSAFITDQQTKKLQHTNTQAMHITSAGWRFIALITTPTQLLLNVGLLPVAWFTMQSNVSPVIMIGVLVAYLDLGSKLFDIGQTIDSVIQAYEDITDLWDFIRNFGVQTYPVLENDNVK